MAGLIEALEGSFIAASLRSSIFLYPLLNTAHILGFSLLVGANLPRNLSTAVTGVRSFNGPLDRILRTSETVGLILALLTGVLLFITRASAYLDSAVFLTKLVLLLMALSAGWTGSRLKNGRRALIRIVASATALLWLAVLTAGRFIGYF